METSPPRVHLIVTSLLVMGCGNIERCRLVERLLVERGFQARTVSEEGRSCTRSFAREHPTGSASDVLGEACEELEAALSSGVHDWKAFVQVSGNESAWATLQAGKPRLLGTSSLPGRSST